MIYPIPQSRCRHEEQAHVPAVQYTKHLQLMKRSHLYSCSDGVVPWRSGQNDDIGSADGCRVWHSSDTHDHADVCVLLV